MKNLIKRFKNNFSLVKHITPIIYGMLNINQVISNPTILFSNAFAGRLRPELIKAVDAAEG